jgi:hypothetical protein
MECNCDDVECQLMLDKTLYDVDRAIDLYCLGSDAGGAGDPERRAAAFGAVVFALLADPAHECLRDDRLTELREALQEFAFEVRWPFALSALPLPPTAAARAERRRIGTLMHSELCLQRAAEPRWARLVEKLAPVCHRELLEDDHNPVIRMLGNALELINARLGHDQAIESCPTFDVSIPPNLETSLDTIANDILANGV